MSVAPVRRGRPAQLHFRQTSDLPGGRAMLAPCPLTTTSASGDWRRKPPLPLTVPRRQHQATWFCA